MDKTTRLIQWQRITIAALLAAVVALGFASYRERQQANATRQALQQLTRSNLLQAAQREVVDARHDGERQVDRWRIERLNNRLQEYEAKYGSTEVVHAYESIEVMPEAGPFGPGAFPQRIAESMNPNGKQRQQR